MARRTGHPPGAPSRPRGAAVAQRPGAEGAKSGDTASLTFGGEAAESAAAHLSAVTFGAGSTRSSPHRCGRSRRSVKRHRARGKRARRPAPSSSSTGANATGSTASRRSPTSTVSAVGSPWRPSVGAEPVWVTSASGAPGRLHVARVVRQRVVAEAHGGAVEAGAVLEPPGRPRPPERPPVAHPPRVVPLADGVERDRLVPHEHLAVHPARDLVAGGARRVGVGRAVGVPVQLEPEGHPLAARVAVHLGRVVEPEGERLAPERHVVERRLDGVVGPQALGAQLERAGPRGGHRVVDHRHERAALAHHAGPVPDRALVGVEADADVAAERAVGRGEVEVPRLVPPRLGTRLVVALVGGGQAGAGRQSCR